MKYFLAILIVLSIKTLGQNEDSTISLEQVSIKSNSKFLVLNSYFRSWIIEDEKLVDYIDGESYFLYPKKDYKKKENIKSYILNYRNFFSPEENLSKKNISISFKNNYYGYWKIPKFNILEGRKNLYKKELDNNSFSIYNENDSLVGNYFNGNDIDSITININYSLKKDMNVSLLRKEHWNMAGKPIYILLKQNESFFKTNRIIYTEIFVLDYNKNNTDNKKNIKSIDFNSSIYQYNYWEEYLKIYPLPKEVSDGLKNLKERGN
ncbi:hypothetical protein ACTS9M_15990 [Empedobacter sp. ULE_I136]